MRTIVFAVMFLSLLMGAETPAFEHPSDNKPATTEFVQRGDLDLSEQISELRKSFTEGWLRTVSIILSVLSIIIVFGIFTAGVAGYVSISRIKEFAEEAKGYAEEIKEFVAQAKQGAESAKASAIQAEGHEAILREMAYRSRPGPRRGTGSAGSQR